MWRGSKSIGLPAFWKPVDIVSGGAARNMAVQVVAKDNLKDILYSTVWEHNPEIRDLVPTLLGADVCTGVVVFKTIPEDHRIVALESASKNPSYLEQI